MIKMTRKKTDSLFEEMTHSLYDKFVENCLIIHDEIIGHKKINYVLFEEIRTRLTIEFGILLHDRGEKTIKINRGTENDEKGETKVKKEVAKKSGKPAKKLVPIKKERKRANINKSS